MRNDCNPGQATNRVAALIPPRHSSRAVQESFQRMLMMMSRPCRLDGTPEICPAGRLLSSLPRSLAHCQEAIC